MKSAFITEGKSQISHVYSLEDMCLLQAEYGLSDSIYDKEDILRNPEAFADLEFIFSTWGMPSFTEDEISTLFPKLKVLFYGAGSVRAFAEPFINKGIQVVSAWMANAVPVAEYAVSQIILANKGFFLSTVLNHNPQAYAEASRFVYSFPGTYRTNVGLLGVGAIGSLVAKMLQSYQVNVYVYDPYLSDEKSTALGVQKESLAFIFQNCQTISNHIANIPETVGMLNYNLFHLMKENATFINTGRGAQVVEDDLVRALTEAPLRTAVLDVTLPEPPTEDSALYHLNNVFLTPHIAGSLGQECFRMGAYITEEALRYKKGKPLQYAVTRKMLETMA